MSGGAGSADVSGGAEDVRVYFETQEAALCAVHCLNGVAQSPLFTAVDLSSAAQDLQEGERRLRAASGVDSAAYLAFLAADADLYVSDEGNFSVDVLARCLQGISVTLDALPSSIDVAAVAREDGLIAFIANLQSHWSHVTHLSTQPPSRPCNAAHSTAVSASLDTGSRYGKSQVRRGSRDEAEEARMASSALRSAGEVE
jgi:hypothetical protein